MNIEERKILVIGEKRYAVNIFVEARYGSRVSITNKGINIRVSKYLSMIDKVKQIDEYILWAKEKIEKKLANSPSLPPYSHGLPVTFLEEKFILEFNPNSSNDKIDCHLEIATKKILFIFPSTISERALQKNIGLLLHKLMTQYFLPLVEKRLHELNNTYIHKKLQNIKLKNTSTRWGSCSHDGNISISTRLLFAPKWVFDYVLIHELCHLVHHNHSASFWNLVEKIYPDYNKAEKYLAIHGGNYNF